MITESLPNELLTADTAKPISCRKVHAVVYRVGEEEKNSGLVTGYIKVQWSGCWLHKYNGHAIAYLTA